MQFSGRDKSARRIQAHYSSITDVISNPIASSLIVEPGSDAGDQP